MRCPTDLPVVAGYDRAWAQTQSLVAQLALQYSALNHCATREALAAIFEAGNSNELILCRRGNSGSSIPVAVLMRASFIIALDSVYD